MKIKGITLLSKEEYEACKDIIPPKLEGWLEEHKNEPLYLIKKQKVLLSEDESEVLPDAHSALDHSEAKKAIDKNTLKELLLTWLPSFMSMLINTTDTELLAVLMFEYRYLDLEDEIVKKYVEATVEEILIRLRGIRKQEV